MFLKVKKKKRKEKEKHERLVTQCHMEPFAFPVLRSLGLKYSNSVNFTTNFK